MQLMILSVVLLLVAIGLITVGMWLGGRREFRPGHACRHQQPHRKREMK